MPRPYQNPSPWRPTPVSAFANATPIADSDELVLAFKTDEGGVQTIAWATIILYVGPDNKADGRDLNSLLLTAFSQEIKRGGRENPPALHTIAVSAMKPIDAGEKVRARPPANGL